MKKITLIEAMIVGVILLMILTMLLPLFPIEWGEYSNGARAGRIIKFSKKGFIWKTWEGQLDLGGMRTDSEGKLVQNIWEFSCNKEEVANQINEAMSLGDKIEVQYSQRYITSYKYGSTDYISTGCKAIGKKAEE